MHFTSHRIIAAATFLLGFFSWNVSTQAQIYPAKPVKVIAPYPAGGGLDTVTRALVERLAPRLGQPVTVENRPGAGATIGADALAKSVPDGYTLMVGSIMDYSLAPHFHRNLTFDMRRDFLPIVEIGFGTIGLVIAPTLAVNSVADLAGFESSTNYTLFAPAGTPDEIVATLNKEVNAILQQSEMRTRMLALGVVVTGGTSEMVRAKIPVEMARWAEVIKAGNIRIE